VSLSTRPTDPPWPRLMQVVVVPAYIPCHSGSCIEEANVRQLVARVIFLSPVKLCEHCLGVKRVSLAQHDARSRCELGSQYSALSAQRTALGGLCASNNVPGLHVQPPRLRARISALNLIYSALRRRSLVSSRQELEAASSAARVPSSAALWAPRPSRRLHFELRSARDWRQWCPRTS
jgi:hypothetical protein